MNDYQLKESALNQIMPGMGCGGSIDSVKASQTQTPPPLLQRVDILEQKYRDLEQSIPKIVDAIHQRLNRIETALGL
jgi:hypothetical protein